MKKKIFYAIFFGIFSVQILSILSVVLIFDNLIKSQTFARLSYVLTHLHTDEIHKILTHQSSGFPTAYRITLLSAQGEVLYDNKAQVESMDNHLMRDEVQEVLKGSYTSPRYIFTQRESKTLNEQTLYATTLVEVDSIPIIVRLSERKKMFKAVIFDLLPYLSALCVFGIILSGVLALILSRKIIVPIENINLSHPLKTNPYPELKPFMQRIAKQKKKIKKQLGIIKARQREIEMIIYNMKEGFILLDTKGAVRSFNAIALEYLNITAEDIVFEIPHLQSMNTEITSMLDDTQGEDRHFECVIGERTLYIVALPVRVKNMLQALALLVIDKSAQKQAEDLRKSFSANVTHELKTPLSVILASSEMLKSGLVKQGDEQSFLTKIYIESKRLSTLIDNILRLSFFDENTLELEKSYVDLYEICKRVQKNLMPLAQNKNIHIYLLPPPQSKSEIWGISSLIEDMVYNLVENAIKYSYEDSTITISLSHKEQYITLSVKDEGIGIPLEEQERIFERFYCVDKSRSKKLGGSGLGLSIVKHIVGIHNARIKLVSKVGKGTSMSVEFMPYET